MKINEIFRSIQGESSYSGKPCIFIRLTGCDLRCNYCDTKYAYYDGNCFTPKEVAFKVLKLYNEGDIIEFTGGEPLLQFNELNKTINWLRLLSNYDPILIETNGAQDLSKIKRGWLNLKNIIFIMDWKGPSSGMNNKMLPSNLKKLRKEDELKFVIGSDEDYNEMVRILNQYEPKCKILIGTVWNAKKRKEIIERMLADGLNARFQLQIHKIIWDVNKRGV